MLPGMEVNLFLKMKTKFSSPMILPFWTLINKKNAQFYGRFLVLKILQRDRNCSNFSLISASFGLSVDCQRTVLIPALAK